MPNGLEKHVFVVIEMFAKLEHVDFSQPHNLSFGFKDSLDVLRSSLHDWKFCCENVRASLTNLLKILFVEVRQLFLSEDRLKNVKHAVHSAN